MSKCSICGQTALYRSSDQFFCGNHRAEACSITAREHLSQRLSFEASARLKTEENAEFNGNQYHRRKFLAKKYGTCMSCGGKREDNRFLKCETCRKAKRSYTGRLDKLERRVGQ